MTAKLTVRHSGPIDVDQLEERLSVLVEAACVVSRVNGDVRVASESNRLIEMIDEVGDVIQSHQPSEIDQLDQLVEKARRVWAGEDTFTQAQAQKILAGLVLVAARHLR